MDRSTVLVFAGPTVSADQVREVLPAARLRPPAARGDLLAEQWRRGDTAVVIDGYFRERRSVGHKEILWLLSEGVDVIGAASMGALRAAELASCGMRGLGTIYQQYATGVIDGDDEVGVLHGPAAVGYPAQTVALVNLRYAATRTDLVPEAAGRRIVAVAKALPFTHRTWTDIGQRLSAADLLVLTTMAQLIDSGDSDLKRLDALAALRTVADHGYAPSAMSAAVTWTGISRSQLAARRTRREYAPGRWMSDLDVLDAARLFDDDYPQVHEEALTDLLTGLAAGADQTLSAYAEEKLGCVAGDDLPAALATWLTAAERAELPPADRLRLVMVRVWPVWQSMDWRAAVLARLRTADRWAHWCDLVAHADEAAEQARFRLVVPPPAILARVFMRHWQRAGSPPEVELARRGFTGPAELGGAVGRFFAYDLDRRRSKVA